MSTWGVAASADGAEIAFLSSGETTQPHHRAAGEALVAHLPDARMIMLPGVGHEAHVVAPDALTAALREFCVAWSGPASIR